VLNEVALHGTLLFVDLGYFFFCIYESTW